jgi:hypothetical protein
MSLTQTENLRDEVDKLFRFYVDGIKIRTKSNLNDSAVNGKNFFRNFFNLIYKYNLSKQRIESPYNETIDLHDTDRKICVQVTARNDKLKVDVTLKHFIEKKKFNLYNELHFIIIDRERNFNYNNDALLEHGVRIFFHDYISIFQTLKEEFDSYDKIKPIYEFVRKECSPTFSETKQQAVEVEELREESTNRLDPTEAETELHIVDRILNALKVFDGFSCIYPRTIARLSIFNSKDSYYDSFSHYCLKTSSIEIHELLQKIKVENFVLTINDESLKPYEEKLIQIFRILNQSLIRCICYREEYTEIEHHKINVTQFNPNCECLFCLYHKFRLKNLFTLLKGKAISHSVNLEDALGEGYYLCKLGEHIKGWQVLNSISEKSKEGNNPVIYFLSLYNIKQIRGFVDSPWWESENQQILPKISSIDLHKTLCSLSIPILLRDELIKVKEEYFLHYSRETIYEQFESILKTNKLYADGGWSSGTTAINLLLEELHILHAFYSSNHIITDDFYTFQEAITKGVEGILVSFTTDENYEYRFKTFDNLILSCIIFYVEEGKFDKLLNEYKIKNIPILETEKNLFLKTITDFFTSQYTTGIWDTFKFNEDISRQDYFSLYRQSLRFITNKIFMILSKVDLSDEELKPITQLIVDFLRADEEINQTNWTYVLRFFETKIQVFTHEQIKTIIELIFEKKQHSSTNNMLSSICNLAFEKAGFVLTDKDFLQRLISSVTTPCKLCKRIHDMLQLLAAWNIADDEGKQMIKLKVIEYLQNKYNPDLYMHAVFKNILTKEEHPELLHKFIECTVSRCSPFDIKQEKGRWRVQSYVGHNYINCLAYMNVDFKLSSVQEISKKSDYYNWLINPETIDYSHFDLRWLTHHCPYFIRKKLYNLDSLKLKVKESLRIKYNSDLAKFLFGN